jgi:hypothetical protein
MRFGLMAPVARPKSVSFTWPLESTRKFCRGLIDQKSMSFTKLIAYLWLEIPMDVPKLVQLGDGCEHFADIKACMFLFEYARII